MAQPLPAFMELFNKIIADLNLLTKNNAVGLERMRALKDLEISAQHLKDLDLSHGFSALGSIEAARGDAEKMHRHHKVSLQYSSDVMLTRNYIVSIAKCGSPQEAIAYGESVLKGRKGDHILADLLARIAWDADDEKAFVKYARMYHDLSRLDHELWPAYLRAVGEIKAISRQCAGATDRACARAGA